MKIKIIFLLVTTVLLLSLCACGIPGAGTTDESSGEDSQEESEDVIYVQVPSPETSDRNSKSVNSKKASSKTVNNKKSSSSQRSKISQGNKVSKNSKISSKASEKSKISKNSNTSTNNNDTTESETEIPNKIYLKVGQTYSITEEQRGTYGWSYIISPLNGIDVIYDSRRTGDTPGAPVEITYTFLAIIPDSYTVYLRYGDRWNFLIEPEHEVIFTIIVTE